MLRPLHLYLVKVTGTGTQKHDPKIGMQVEALYLVIQAGSKPGGPSNKASNPKRGRKQISSRVNRQTGS